MQIERGSRLMRRPLLWLIAMGGASLAYAVLPAASLASSSSPVIEGESVSHVTPTDATLEAQIDPNGLYTAYEFQIDTNGSYDYTKPDCPLPLPGSMQCESITDGPPLPAGLVEPKPEYIPAGLGSQSVSVDLASIGATLDPATTYHYRVIASNDGQIVDGPDQTFTTPSAGNAPVIESVSLSHLTRTDATLEAKVNTEGLATAFQFHMWTSCAHEACEYMANIPLPPGELLGSFVSQSVSLDLNSAGVTLKYGSEYGWGITATSGGGSASANGGVFEPPEGLFEPLGSKVSPKSGGGQPLAFGGGGQPAGSGTLSPPVLDVSSPPGGSAKAGAAKGMADKHKHHGKKAKKHRAKATKHKHHKG
jgi:hypothetical protein